MIPRTAWAFPCLQLRCRQNAESDMMRFNSKPNPLWLRRFTPHDGWRTVNVISGPARILWTGRSWSQRRTTGNLTRVTHEETCCRLSLLHRSVLTCLLPPHTPRRDPFLWGKGKLRKKKGNKVCDWWFSPSAQEVPSLVPGEMFCGKDFASLCCVLKIMLPDSFDKEMFTDTRTFCGNDEMRGREHLHHHLPQILPPPFLEEDNFLLGAAFAACPATFILSFWWVQQSRGAPVVKDPFFS